MKSFSKELKRLVIKIKLISVNLPENYLKILEVLVSEGKFPNRSEAIRVGIRDLIRTEYLIEESVKRNLNPSLVETEIESEI
jgi:Arc/MetJ-type ribon-helix-helix transcriptional regulator